MPAHPSHDFSDTGVAWHALAESQVLAKLEASWEGLSTAQAELRRREFGHNVLPVQPPPTLWAIFGRNLLSPLIYILLAAGVVALFLGDRTDAGFILAVVLLDAGLGTYQEWHAERSAASLRQLLRVVARVRRNGVAAEIAAEELVPGDLVQLESGARVPADLRLLQANHLSLDAALLTGESAAVESTAQALAAHLALADRRNMAFAGADVVAGRGAGFVVAIGAATEVGQIAGSLGGAETAKPPLVIRIERFSRDISLAALAACALLAGVAWGQGMPLLEVFYMAVALAVSAVPEGLPVAMTVALSIATRRMARRNVIVRQLTAVEGLGSCTYIASDKTGTLTANKQTVTAVWLPGSGRVGLEHAKLAVEAGVRERLQRLLRIGAVCNEASAHKAGRAWQFAGDAVDVAFWELAVRAGLDPVRLQRQVAVLGEIPFESERAYAAKLYEDEGALRVGMKGAPEVVLAHCGAMLGAAGEVPLDPARLEWELAALTRSGLRVMAVAEARLAQAPPAGGFAEPDLPPLVLLGLAGLMDPPRPGAREAVARCRQAGIRVGMVTGDHPLTALAVAREVGIASSEAEILTGAQLAKLGSDQVPQFVDAVDGARVFARVSPLQKLQIVAALVKLGHFVAVTGDGVNDAPALRRAHIGVAMGSGTDVTKATAAIILADNQFASLEAGVEEGRFAYDNIRKVAYLLVSTGAAEVALFVLALLAGTPLPLLPVQLLWLNLVTNGIQDVALAFEAGEPGAMQRPPRPPREGLFNRLMIAQTALSGGVMGLVAFLDFYFLTAHGGLAAAPARNHLLLLMVLMENVHVFNCRSESTSAFRIPLGRNPMLVAGVAIAQGIHLLAMRVPLMQRILQVGPLPLHQMLLPLGLAATVLLAMELFKWVQAHAR
ncbi:MAG TPA: HAD-IC family P-type ATPase [Terriglobales bacterium]|nr:HAD-IC family P-type ATPase [Terriglobales bacterium]